jgi:hypothetical protein
LKAIAACGLKAFIYKPLETIRLSLYSRQKAMDLLRLATLSA